MKKVPILLMLAVAMFALAACNGGGGGTAGGGGGGDAYVQPVAPGQASGDLTVWSFTTEAQVIATAFQGANPNVNLDFQITPMEDGMYLEWVWTSLAVGGNVPDIVFMEADFVRSFVLEPNMLQPLTAIMGEAASVETIPFTIQAGTDDAGVVRALSYQATPGAMFYRRSLAQRYFGTDDPATLEPMFATLDGFVENARLMHAQSGGSTRVVASPTEVFRAFLPNRTNPWVVNDTLTIDPLMEEYMTFAFNLRQEGLDAEIGQWDSPWFDGMRGDVVDAAGNPLEIFSFFLPTWGLPFVLMTNAPDTAGDWGIIPGPLPFQWGGTWLGVTELANNPENAIEFVRFATLDEDHLRNWATGVYTNAFLSNINPNIPDGLSQDAGDLVSSALLIRELGPTIAQSPAAAFIGGQNPYEIFGDAALDVSFGLQQGTDQTIGDAFIDAVDMYISGIMTRDEAIASFRGDVGMAIPQISVN
ncbi:MAG: ABC transporter substrate-binding protein [Firmicutes bacterium]|nr:ABC transporter substrate-binding protein [Bacillota bacterium]